MKKQLIIGGFAAFCLVLIMACTNIFAPSIKSNRSEGSFITVSLGDGQRTLLPTSFLSRTDVSIKLSFDNGTPGDRFSETFTSGPMQVKVNPGTWTITAQVFYTGGGDEELELVAQGTSPATTINANENKYVSIQLSMPTDLTGKTGIFSYNITLPPVALSSAELVLQPLFGSLPDSEWPRYNLLQGLSGMDTLPAGYYLLQMVFVSNGVRVGKAEVLHLYPDVETAAVYAFDADAFAVNGKKLLIWQTYGTGSDGGSVSNSFIELYNLSAEDINLDGYTVYYRGKNGSDDGWQDTLGWRGISLAGKTIKAGSSFLIVGKAVAASAARLQLNQDNADLPVSDLEISNRAYKIALIKGTGTLAEANPFDIGGGTMIAGYIDMVGALNDPSKDTIDACETGTVRISKQKAARRNSLEDSDNNSVDFDSVDYQTSGVSDRYLSQYKPRNSAFGPWNPAPVPKLLIWQVYGTGGNTSGNEGTISHSFVELYNPTGVDVALNGYSLYYKKTGVPWDELNLTGIIKAGHSFLVLGSKENPNGRLQLDENKADMRWNETKVDGSWGPKIFSNDAFKVALIRGSGELNVVNPFDVNGEVIPGYVDMVGVTNTDPTDGYETTSAVFSKQKSARRGSLKDTDNNVSDFQAIDYRVEAIPDIRLVNFYSPKYNAYGAWDPVTPVMPPSQIPADLLILQAYGNGGATDGSVSHSFIELYNSTGANINLSGYSVQYSTGDGNWQKLNLSGNIPSKTSYLILGEKQNSSARLDLTGQADATWTGLDMDNQQFAVCLMHNTNTLSGYDPASATGFVDLLGATNGAKQNFSVYETRPFTDISKQKAARRRNFVDTNDNSVDFVSINYQTSGVDATGLETYRPKNTVFGQWPASPSEDSPVLILQAGAATNGAITHNFVELYNTGDTQVNLEGYSLQYAGGYNGTPGTDGDWTKLDLSGTIQPHSSFLILGKKRTSAGDVSNYEIPDNSGDINASDFVLDNAAFKIALMSNTTLLTVENPFDEKTPGYVDMLGAVNSNNINGFETQAMPKISKQQAARRKSLVDTDNNYNDFESVDYRVSNLPINTKYPRNQKNGAWDPCPSSDGPSSEEPTDNPPPGPIGNKLLILQIGAATDGNISRSFVELYNNGDTAVNLGTYSLQYAAGFSTNAGNGAPDGNATTDGLWTKVNLTGTIQPKHSFLILGSEKATASGDSPPALAFQDNYGDMNLPTFDLNNRAVKVALMSNQTLLNVQNPYNTDDNWTKATGYVDMVGAINTAGTDNINGYEQNFIANLNKQAGQRRTSLVDSDNNAADFERTTFANMVTKSGGVITNYTAEYETKRPKNHAYGAWDPFPSSSDDEPPAVNESKTLMILQANTFGNNNNLDGAKPPASPTGGGFPVSLVELYNNTNETIDLDSDNYYLYIGDASSWTYKIKLEGLIPVHCSFLIVTNNTSEINQTPRAILPQADQTADFRISNNNFKVALMKNRATLSAANPFTDTSLKADYVDMLGVGTTNGYETAAASTSRPQGPRRTSLVDTDNNAADFAQADYRGYNGVSTGMPDNELYKYWPRNAAAGAWNPITGDQPINPALPGNSSELAFNYDSGVYSSSINLTLTVSPGWTIYYSRDGSIPSPEKAGNGSVFQYSSPISITSGNLNGQNNANVLATNANIDQMNVSSSGNYHPTATQVPKAAVIRAIAVDGGGKQSDVITKTYFVGTLPSVCADYPIISMVSDPVNLLSDATGILVRGGTGKKWSEPDAININSFNFQQDGADWERDAYMEIFNGSTNSRTVGLSTGVGIRPHGGYSREFAQKSLNVYFRAQYGINNLKNYPLIPGAVDADGNQMLQYKSFILRNGGDDTDTAKIHDAFSQYLLSDRSFGTQAQTPCIVYLNGEYWGPYNLCEKYGDNHAEYKYGVNKDNVIGIKDGELSEGVKGEELLYTGSNSSMISAGTKTMSGTSGTANYNAFCNIVDIDNLIDYFAAEIYLYNYDWPDWNYRLWRTRTDEGSFYGDKKWRWQMFDMDEALSYANNGVLTVPPSKGATAQDTFYKILNGDARGEDNNKMFKALLGNEEFCRKFVNTMLDLYNVNFNPNNWQPKLDTYTAIYQPLMTSYFSRWGGSSGDFTKQIGYMTSFMTDMRGVNGMVNNLLPDYFGGGPHSTTASIANIGITADGLKNVTVNGGSIKINTITVPSGWTGQYYTGNPITVTANASGFKQWVVTGGIADNPNSPTTKVTITGDATITAVYN